MCPVIVFTKLRIGIWNFQFIKRWNITLWPMQKQKVVKIYCTMANPIVKRGDIWDLGHMQNTWGLVVLKVTLTLKYTRSFQVIRCTCFSMTCKWKSKPNCNLGLMGFSSTCMRYILPFSVQSYFGVIRCTCRKMPWFSKVALPRDSQCANNHHWMSALKEMLFHSVFRIYITHISYQLFMFVFSSSFFTVFP